MSFNRFKHFGQSLTASFGVKHHYIGLELGSSTVRLVCNGSIRAQKESVVSQIGAIRSKQIIAKGVIADVSAAQALVYSLVPSLADQPSFLAQYSAWCVIPSASTQIEQDLFLSALPKIPWVTWKLLPKAQVYKSNMSHFFSDAGMQTSIDIGADTTELHIFPTSDLAEKPKSFQSPLLQSSPFQYPQKVQQSFSETLYWGTRDLEQMLQMLIRDIYQVQLSPESFAKVFTQLGTDLFSAKTVSKANFAVRAQSLVSGRPITITLKAQDIQPAFLEWFEYLTLGLQVILHRNRTLEVSSALEQGIVIIGGGATIGDIVAALSDFFAVPTTTVPEPRLWLVKGLQLLTKNGL